MKPSAALEEDENQGNGGEDRTNDSKLHGTDEMADWTEDEADHDQQQNIGDAGAGEQSHEEMSAEDECADASGCKESGRRRCYGNWGTQTSRTQGTSIPRRLVAKRADASPKIVPKLLFAAPVSNDPSGLWPAYRAIARRPAGFAAAVPTVRILSISYRLLSNTFAQVFSSDA